MRVVVAGGHGKVALRLERLLAARGDSAVGLVRDPDQLADLTAAGASAAVTSTGRSCGRVGSPTTRAPGSSGWTGRSRAAR
jgi:nucleoside-diphosphate-sugar epimerase